MKLFLKLPIPWVIDLAYVLVRLAVDRVASIPIAQKMDSIHSQLQEIDLRAN